jgi:hypothetical protein
MKFDDSLTRAAMNRLVKRDGTKKWPVSTTSRQAPGPGKNIMGSLIKTRLSSVMFSS